VRETAQHRRIQFLGLTANPIDQELVGGKYRLALLRETAAALELPVDGIVPSDDEFDAQQSAKAEAMQKQQAEQIALQKEQLQLEHSFKMDEEAAMLPGSKKEAGSIAKNSDFIKGVVPEELIRKYVQNQTLQITLVIWRALRYTAK
jgi:hypothetical protein